jgi:molybdate/tungstate transport system substrate-binding protein
MLLLRDAEMACPSHKEIPMHWLLAIVQTVSVLYAGSLVTPMEGPVAQTLLSTQDVTFAGESGGSKKLANFIRDGLRSPDVFISADSKLVDQLAQRGLVASRITFGSGSMVLGYSPVSPKKSIFEAVAADRMPLVKALETPGLRIARTDPQLDPKGARTIEAMHLLTNDATVNAILGADENPTQIFPEESLLARLETGEADVGFLYSTEATARHIPAIPLPGKASLSGEITYTLAVMKAAPHPEAAQKFVDFILHGAGKRILEDAGVTYQH